MSIDVTRLNPGDFEDFCNKLLRREVSDDVTAIDGAGGDKGVDGFIGDVNGDVTVFQYKFYTDRLSKAGRKRKIEKSFDTAREHHPEMREWVLLIARDFTHGEQEWFEETIVDTARSLNIDVDVWTRTDIEDRAANHDALINQYFHGSTMSLQQRQRKLLNYLSADVVGKTSIINNELLDLQEKHPGLGIEYEFSSENDISRVSLNPSFDVSIHTELDVSEAKKKRVRNRESVEFTGDEITSLKFDPDIFPETDLEPGTIEVKPWYDDWEEKVKLEVPGGFQKELTLTITDVTDTGLTVKAREEVFGITIQYNPSTSRTRFEIEQVFHNQPVHEIAELLRFVDAAASHNHIVLRRIEDGLIVFRGEIEERDGVEELEWFNDMISKLEVIEARTGTSFSIGEEISEEDELNILIAEELLTNGEAPCPYTFEGEIHGVREEFVRAYDEEPGITAKTVLEEFYITILGEDVEIGDVEFVYPGAEVENMDEIRAAAGNSSSAEFKVRPSEESVIKLVE